MRPAPHREYNVVVDQCSLEGNFAGNLGGGLVLVYTKPNTIASILNSNFTGGLPSLFFVSGSLL